jgi:predicted acylesterase/phospholipase RssA
MIDQNREAVIAIQGGGVYALSLLGQAEAVFRRGYIPLAFAGTSGGAILASLLWSGLTPGQIRDEFVGMVKRDPKALINLLSPFEPPPEPHFDFDAFLALRRNIEQLMRSIPTDETDERRGIWQRIKSVGKIPGFVGTVLDVRAVWSAIQPHMRRRGLFSGANLEKTINRLIRNGLGEQPGLPPQNEFITFGHITDMMKRSGSRFFRPPLLLTATNLSRRRLELINSADPSRAGMPIAAAVRASAGFPIFFRPRGFGDALNREWFVDGGVIANFPIWAFSDAFRQDIATSERYSQLAWRPWVRIGLRVVDDLQAPDDLSDPMPFLSALVRMLTGAARNQLEDILATVNMRSVIIRQSTSSTEGPGVLEVGDVNEAKINRMIDLGRAAAEAELDKTGAPGVYTTDSEAESRINSRLRAVIDESRRIFAGDDPKFRANIFIPVRNRLKMVLSVNMEGDSDHGLELPSLTSGVTGACYQLSTAIVCNLQKVAQLRSDPHDTFYKALFDMPIELQRKVKADRTWLMSMPIFDPQEVRVLATRRRPAVAAEVPRAAIRELGIALSGPVLGVLNLDAAWDYAGVRLDPDPDVQISDPRIRAIADIMQVAALTIGTELATS